MECGTSLCTVADMDCQAAGLVLWHSNGYTIFHSPLLDYYICFSSFEGSLNTERLMKNFLSGSIYYRSPAASFPRWHT